MKQMSVFTDGACRGNPGPGGWGALLRYDNNENNENNKSDKTISGGELNTTNNRMELMAAIKALAEVQEASDIKLYTDSQYVQKGITEWLPGWKKRQWKKADNKPVKNVDLWQELDKQTQRHRVSWHWVRGHNGHIENELVDRLANNAIDQLKNK